MSARWLRSACGSPSTPLAAERGAGLRQELFCLRVAGDTRREAAEGHRQRDQRDNQPLHLSPQCGPRAKDDESTSTVEQYDDGPRRKLLSLRNRFVRNVK